MTNVHIRTAIDDTTSMTINVIKLIRSKRLFLSSFLQHVFLSFIVLSLLLSTSFVLLFLVVLVLLPLSLFFFLGSIGLSSLSYFFLSVVFFPLLPTFLVSLVPCIFCFGWKETNARIALRAEVQMFKGLKYTEHCNFWTKYTSLYTFSGKGMSQRILFGINFQSPTKKKCFHFLTQTFVDRLTKTVYD